MVGLQLVCGEATMRLWWGDTGLMVGLQHLRHLIIIITIITTMITIIGACIVEEQTLFLV